VTNLKRCTVLLSTLIMVFVLLAPALVAQGRTLAAGGPGAAAQRKALKAAYAKEAAKLGLPAIQPRPVVPINQITQVNTAKYKKPAPYTIAFASQGPTNSWARIYDYVFKYRLDSKYKRMVKNYYYTDAGGNAGKQVSDINDLLVRRPDILVVTPLGAAVKGPVERAARMGIPVVFCADAAPTNKFISLVNRDNYLNGALEAEWLVQQLHGKGAIIAESGIAGVDTAIQRYNGAMSVFSKHPSIHILSHVYADWSPTKGKEVTDAVLAAHPKIDGVWSDSGLQMAGAIQSFVSAHRTIPPMTGEPFNGFLRLAKQYHVKFLAVDFPPIQSAVCADTAIRILQGKPVSNYVNVPALTVTSKNLGKYYNSSYTDDMWSDLLGFMPKSQLAKLGLVKG